ncbi:transglutaminase-like domain-containing protein [Glaciibacter sp. 2TAF33]|uniref:transglutaminase-like domain-containing protein n=1 Tax=Glaciibacter sp. 2TAF33 TaxID=3233015 RepID=UPI003F925878
MSIQAARQAKPAVRRRAGFVAGNVLGLAATTAAAAATLWPVYQSTDYLVLVAATFGLGALVALLGAFFRWPSWALMVAIIVVYFAAGVPLAIPGRAVAGLLPTTGGLLELVTAAALSWKQLVTIVLPVGAYQSLLVPAFILVLISTVVGLSVALRARRGELAVLAPIALFLAGIALGASSANSPIEVGLGLFTTVLFWLLWLRWQRRRQAVRLVAQQSRATIESRSDRHLGAARGLVGAAVIIAIAIAAGGVAAIASPASGPRDVLRSAVQQPFNPRDYPSPLSAFRSYLQPERSAEPMLTVEGLPVGGRIRIATLDSYDGVVYSVGSEDVSSASGSFTRLPYRLDQDTVSGDQATLDVTVKGYTGVWVPGVGQLERITFLGDTATARADSFFYNDNSGTGAVLGGLRPGDRFRAESVVPPAADDVAKLEPGNHALPAIGVVPDGLAQALDSWVKADDPPGQQLKDMLDGLKAEGYISHGIAPDEPVSRSGHGADRIAQLFSDRPMLGDQEQYAVAAALLARQIGFPARVVLGFVPARAADGTPVTVVGADISAWIEVETSAGSWVSLDPNPAVRDIPAQLPDEPTVVSRPQSVVPPPVPDTTQQRDLTPPDSTQDDPPKPLDPVTAFLLAALAVTGWTLLGLALVVSPFLAIIVAKVRRRRLRVTAASSIDRITGGWREFADSVVDYGLDVPPAATRTELAESVGGIRPLVLASVVDRAMFAPAEPSRADADSVWADVRELRVSLASGRNRRQRLKALISLRSFGRYAGTGRKGAVS